MVKKYFVTGATGFIGVPLVRKLVNKGEVTVLVRDKKRIPKDLEDKLKIIESNITKDFGNFDKIDEIFHLAGIISPIECEKDPQKAFLTNVYGTFNVLNLARIHNSKLVFPSSCYVYGNSESESKESSPLNPETILGYTKFVSETLIRNFSKKYNFPAIMLRLFTVYGPGSNPQQFIPSTIRKIKNNEKLSFGNLDSVRDFVFIDDVIDAFLKVSEYKPSGIFNIAGGKPTIIRDIVKHLCLLKGDVGQIYENDPSFKHPDTKSKGKISMYANIQKAKKELGWTPKTTLEKGLKITYENLK